jgi:hypothetical protein
MANLHPVGDAGDQQRIGRHGLDRVHHAHMRDTADRVQHVRAQDHPLSRFLAHPPDQVAGRRAFRIVPRVDPKRFQAQGQRCGEAGGGIGIGFAHRDVAHSEARAHQAVPHRFQAEPVYLPAIRIFPRMPGAAQQGFGAAPVLDVGNADQHDPVRSQGVGVASDHAPGVAQALQDPVVDDAIDALGHIERQRVDVQVGDRDLVQLRCRLRRGDRIGGDAQQTGLGVDRTTGSGERQAAASHLEDRARRQRDPRQQVGSIGWKQHGPLWHPASFGPASRIRSSGWGTPDRRQWRVVSPAVSRMSAAQSGEHLGATRPVCSFLPIPEVRHAVWRTACAGHWARAR